MGIGTDRYEKRVLAFQKKVRRCEVVRGRTCRPEYVLKFDERVIEDCSREPRDEVCVEKSHKTTVHQDNIFCHRENQIICGEDESADRINAINQGYL